MILILLVKLFQALILRSSPTLRSDVDDEHDFAVKLLEIIRLALLVERFQIVKSRCRGHDKSTLSVAEEKTQRMESRYGERR